MKEPLVLRFEQDRTSLVLDGPTIRVGIGAPGASRPREDGLAALIDSGASNCIMTPAVADRLALPFVGTGSAFHLGSGVVTSPLHKGRLFIPAPGGGYAVDLAEIGVLDLSPPHQFIVGRKAIHEMTFTVDYWAGWLELRLP